MVELRPFGTLSFFLAAHIAHAVTHILRLAVIISRLHPRFQLGGVADLAHF